MKRNTSPLAVAAALALLGHGARTALAQTYTWTGAVNNTWNTTTANWAGAGSVWVNGDTRDAVFSAGAATLTVGSDITANNISFNTSLWSLINGLTPRTITLAGTGSGVHVQTGAVGINVPIAGAVGLTKTGSGTLTVGAASTYTGATTISDGVMALGISNCLPTSTVVSVANSATLSLAATQQIAGLIGGGTMEAGGSSGLRNLGIANTSDATFSGVITNGVNTNGTAITKSGSGVQTLGGTAPNTYSGGTTINGGVLVAAKNDALGTGTVAITNSTLALEDGPVLSGGEITVGGTVPAGRAGNIEALSGTSVITNPITLTAPATIGGSGILVMTNTINAGTNTLTFDAVGSGVFFPVSVTSTATGVGLNKIGTGDLVTDSNHVYAGRAVINGGTMTVKNTSTVQTVGMRVATEGNVAAVTVQGVLQVDSFFTVGDSLSGVGAGGTGMLTVASGGTVRLGPAARLTIGWVNAIGTLNLNSGGLLEIGGVNGLQRHATANTNVNLAGGRIKVVNSDLTSSVPMTTTAVPFSTIDTNGLNATLSGTISGSAGLVKSGAGVLTLSGTNSFETGMFLDGGVVSVSQDANLGHMFGGIGFNGGTLRATAGFSINRDLAVFTNGTVEVVTGTLESPIGPVRGPGSLSKTGAGVFTVRALRNDGAVNVDAGTLAIAVGGDDFHASHVGSVTVGDARLDLHHNDMVLTNSSAATVQAMINSARNGGSWDGNGITSSAARNASPKNTTLGVLTGAEYIPIGGALFDGFTIASTDTLVKYTYYGDTDFNGVVDFDDYSRVDAGFNNNRTGWLNGDVDSNGIVDFDDYSLIDLAFNTQSGTLRRAMSYLQGDDRSDAGMNLPSLRMIEQHFEQFGNGYASSFLNAVPEPASVGLLVLAGLGLIARRRRASDH